MAGKNNVSACITIFLTAMMLLHCSNNRKYEFVCKNTLSIFLLHDGNNYYFSIPIQYMGDFQINNFKFDNGYVLIGDYKILLKRDGVRILVYHNDDYDDMQSLVDYVKNGHDVDSIADYFKIDAYGSFNAIYVEENGKTVISKMEEPGIKTQEPDTTIHQYNIYIERIINNNELKNIVNEYKKGNSNSRFEINFDIVIDNEEQTVNGLMDDFEIDIINK